MAGFWASRGVFRIRTDDARVGGFLALATGIVGAAIASPRRPGDDRHPRPRRPPIRTRYSTTRPGSCSSALGFVAVGVVVGWLAGRTVFDFKARRPADPDAISRARPRSPPSCSIFAHHPAAVRPDRLLLDGRRRPRRRHAGRLPRRREPDQPGARRSGRADRRARDRAASSALLRLAWARRGDNARLFPVWVGGLTTGLVAAMISAPIAAGVFGGVTGGGTDALVALFRTLGLERLPIGVRAGPDQRPARQDDQLHDRLRHPRRAADHGPDDVQPRRGRRSPK